MNTPPRDQHRYEIYVGSIGHVYTVITANERIPAQEFNDWVHLSKLPYSRYAGETVTLMRDDEIYKEFKHEPVPSTAPR